jgi:hypothetical protein
MAGSLRANTLAAMQGKPMTDNVRSSQDQTWIRTLRDELAEIVWLASLSAALSVVGVGFVVLLALIL